MGAFTGYFLPIFTYFGPLLLSLDVRLMLGVIITASLHGYRFYRFTTDLFTIIIIMIFLIKYFKKKVVKVVIDGNI